MNIAAYCRDAQIKPSYFHAWRRRLTEAASGIRIRLSSKLSIEVDRRFDPFTLRAVVETLGGLSRCSA